MAKQNGQPHMPAQLDTLLRDLKKQAKAVEERRPSTSASAPQHIRPVTIDEKIRKQKIENDNIIRDQQLKEATLRKLFRFLGVETAIIFALAFLQGFHWGGFGLDEWSFRIVLSATILQITAMLTIAVQHLFPKKK